MLGGSYRNINSQSPWLTLPRKHILDVIIGLSHRKCSFVSVTVKRHLEALWIFQCPCDSGLCESGKCKCKLSEPMYPLLWDDDSIYTSPTFSKEEFAASSHEGGQSLPQFQVESIRRWQSISFGRDKVLMIFYIAKCYKFSIFQHFLYHTELLLALLRSVVFVTFLWDRESSRCNKYINSALFG